MTKFLRTVVAFLLFRIDWRKLFIVCSILMVGSVLIQISSLPYPLTGWISRPPPLSSFKPVRTSLHLGKTRDAPVVVSFNSSVRLNTNMAISKKESRQRSKRNNVKSIDIVLPHSPPRIVRSRPSRRLERYLSSLTPDEALAFVKRDIENVSRSDDDDDPELYAPIFRNISTFKRSYRWMERMLKVYIYQEGDKPIFHMPDLHGIYSSEGWFMRLIEGNRQFVTKEPEKAHLFYLPYSARQLQVALYVPNSHNLKPLAVFLRDYVNMLAAKYPFWNRTRGSDHFLVACHDWGPYTVKSHKDLARNTIKVLCNADLSEGVFKSGKDVSLPETKIRNPRRPLRNVGGKRVSQRPILAFFAGNRHGRVRNVLIQHWRDKEDDMRIFGPLPNRVSRVMSYPEHMKSSKYCICPMGFEVNSPRIVEAIYNECVPVIIADNFVPPLNDVLNWEAFSVIIAEKDIPKLKERLLAIPLRRYIAMQTNVKKLQKHFLWHAKPMRYDLFHMILHSVWSSRLNQIQIPQTSLADIVVRGSRQSKLHD